MTVTTHTAGPDNRGDSPVDHPHPVVVQRLTVRGRAGLALLLLGTAAAYLVNLSAGGYGNSFYAAAAQAGAQNWEAFFFGSSDAGNSVTVDKTPLSLWPSALAVKLFGLSSWSILVPYVLVGVAAVALLWSVVRRYAGVPAAFVAAVVLATTPVTVLMFRYNNPDVLLVLLMIAALWAVLRCCEDGRWRWAVAAGVFIGLGFLAKQLQVVLVVPGLVLAFIVACPRSWKVRAGQLLAALGAAVVSAGWYLAVVELWPEDSRPYIGGSQNNSIIELTLGYNGLGRINGDETGAVTGGGGRGAGMPGGAEAGGGFGAAGGPTGMWGETGILRMFEPAQGGQIAWLIPAALILAVAVLVVVRRRPRTDLLRASVLAWSGWLIVTGIVFSFMQGIFHQYYTVALSPAVAALVGTGTVTLWKHRKESRWTPWVLAIVVAVTTVWSYILLDRTPDFVPWLKFVVVVCGLVSTVALAAVALGVTGKAVAAVAVIAGGTAGLAGPVAYSVDTLATAHSGAIVTAGPEVSSGFGPGGRPGGAGGPGRMQDGMAGGMGGEVPSAGRDDGSGQLPAPGGGGQAGGLPGGQAGGLPGGQAGGLPGGQAGGPGGLNGASADAEVVDLLEQDSGSYVWAAAAVGSQTAAEYQLATGEPVMSVGGYNGSDPTPTLEQFKDYVREGKIHYFLGSGTGGRGQQMGGSTVSTEISEWVADNFAAVEKGGMTVYDLSVTSD
ncbi:ArnT family glycosyltransferase [Corynebacterium provencense]|uniref:ArnT family glycosyltransferase n=1 Tax=Corynebacterium provencense TaxID=1737425 RepID=UPI00082F56E2|nr:glycosyltransferase family 39 protein [Corynebacterium provencense]